MAEPIEPPSEPVEPPSEPVELPPELADALAGAADARKAFNLLPESHQREYADWVDEAKKADTRTRRAERALEQIKAVARGL